MRDYTKSSTEQLKRSWRNLDDNTSAMTVEDELRRMAVLDTISTELQRRDEELPA